jgi:hypothetical protein
MRRLQTINERLCELTGQKASSAGWKAELAGLHSIKITRNGRFQGLWCQSVGSYDWYPAGQNLPEHRAPTIEEVAHYMARTLSKAG